MDDCIISSVVPPVFNSVYTGLVKMTGKHPLVVGPGIKTGLNIQMDVPSQVGSDRIVIAVAALAEYEPPLLLMDMGTATTIEVVDRGSTYLGGCIIPGVRVSAEAFSSRAAQLPGIRLDQPGRVIGKNTVECMRSGIMYGTAAMMDGMLDRVEEELGPAAWMPSALTSSAGPRSIMTSASPAGCAWSTAPSARSPTRARFSR